MNKMSGMRISFSGRGGGKGQLSTGETAPWTVCGIWLLRWSNYEMWVYEAIWLSREKKKVPMYRCSVKNRLFSEVEAN